jgi:hypothetical protein
MGVLEMSCIAKDYLKGCIDQEFFFLSLVFPSYISFVTLGSAGADIPSG